MRFEGAERSALLVFRDALGELGVNATPLGRGVFIAIHDDDRFRLEDDSPLLGRRLEDVAHLDADLLSDALGDDDLVFVFDSNDGHGKSDSAVELFNCGQSSTGTESVKLAHAARVDGVNEPRRPST
jgi:hypothetical protein